MNEELLFRGKRSLCASGWVGDVLKVSLDGERRLVIEPEGESTAVRESGPSKASSCWSSHACGGGGMARKAES